MIQSQFAQCQRTEMHCIHADDDLPAAALETHRLLGHGLTEATLGVGGVWYGAATFPSLCFAGPASASI